MKGFTENDGNVPSEQIAGSNEVDAMARIEPLLAPDVTLVPNRKYRLTRQMFLFPEQEVSAETNDYLKIGSVVTYLKSGGLVDDRSMLWVYVRSEKHSKMDMGKGQEGWCFSRYLQTVENEEAGR
jgi:hypothetical protein